MRILFTILVFLMGITNQLMSQNCDGSPPTTVMTSVSGYEAAGGLGNAGNTSNTICGFPPNGNIVGLEWAGITANTVGDSWCSELRFDLNGEVILTPFDLNDSGGCGPETGGSMSILQDLALEITADASGCISIESYLSYTVAPVGIDVTSGSFTFTACPAGIPLPIEILSLQAEQRKNFNLVSWTTAQEINNNVQMVERSHNGMSDWEAIGKVSGTNSSKEITYEIVDENPLQTSYYRIHSVDFDGKEQFSKIVYVKRNTDKQNTCSVHPNLASNFIDVEINSSKDDVISYKILDTSGKIVESSVWEVTEESTDVFTLDISNLMNGLYIVSITGNDIYYNAKIMKVD